MVRTPSLETTSIHHWYHVFADGNWQHLVTEHVYALKHFGLYALLDNVFFGIVGAPHNVELVEAHLKSLDINFTICATADTGYEQVTQKHMWEFSLDNDGLCSYGHTKSASKPLQSGSFDDNWRKGMEWYNFCQWDEPVTALLNGSRVAGCHWMSINHSGSEHHHNHPNQFGFFPGTFWWSWLDEIRKMGAPGEHNRYCAEHWIGQADPQLTMDHIYQINHPNISIGSYPHEALSWYHPT